MNIRLLAFAGLLTTAACQNAPQQNNTKPDALAAHADTTVRPGDDFFAFANGTWIKNNPIPADEVNYGIGELVEKELRDKLLTINNDALKQAAKTGTAQLIGDFWYSALDTTNIEQQGITPIKPMLDAIAAIPDKNALLNKVMELHHTGTDLFFSGVVSQDARNSDVQAYILWQGGLGLGSKDYYLNPNSSSQKVVAQYPVFIARLFSLAGTDSINAARKAAAVIAFETELARVSRSLEAQRDPIANYNKYAISQLKKLIPGMDWATHLQQLGVHSVDSVIIGQPEFYTGLDKAIAKTNLETLKDYMTFHVIRNYAEYLSKPFADASFDFYNRTIRGAQQQQDRQRRALDWEQEVIGEALGQLFVKEFFGDKAKARYEQIVENVRMAYKARIEKLDWMSEPTRQQAIHKLMAITKKVGYPDRWKDFSSMKITRGPLAQNMMSAAEWWYNYQMNKLGKPVDRTEWSMTPQTYNAYYNESNNEIVLPAAMMTVPGYKDEELDDALVYGYMAASTVGHEITHGFDDQGRQYDEKGNMRNWWQPQDSIQFVQRAEILVQQFNKMTPIDTIHINGRATLGENLADLGGILIGLDAFKQTETYKNGGTIAGYTQLQRFFMGYALGWMMVQRPEVTADHLLTDVHSPAKYRVNGPFPNVPEFYEAFSIKPGDKMYLPVDQRVHLW